MLNPPVVWQPPHEAGPGSQLGWGLALPTNTPTEFIPATTKQLIQPTKQTPLEYITLLTRGSVLLGPIGYFVKFHLSSDQKIYNCPIEYTGINGE